MHLREMRRALAILHRARRPLERRPPPRWQRPRPWRPWQCRYPPGSGTGASLMPSPTKASFALRRFLAQQPLDLGRPYPPAAARCSTSSTPSSLGRPALPTALASPVSMTVFSTPACLSAAMACLAWGLTTSEITICPAYDAVNRHMHDRADAVAVDASSTPNSSMSLLLPAHTRHAHRPRRAHRVRPISSTSRHAAAVDRLAVGLAAGNGQMGCVGVASPPCAA